MVVFCLKNLGLGTTGIYLWIYNFNDLRQRKMENARIKNIHAVSYKCVRMTKIDRLLAEYDESTRFISRQMTRCYPILR